MDPNSPQSDSATSIGTFTLNLVIETDTKLIDKVTAQLQRQADKTGCEIESVAFAALMNGLSEMETVEFSDTPQPERCGTAEGDMPLRELQDRYDQVKTVLRNLSEAAQKPGFTRGEALALQILMQHDMAHYLIQLLEDGFSRDPDDAHLMNSVVNEETRP